MLEKMMSVLASFSSLGSGWTLENVLKVDVKFARFRLIHGSSYIALPSKIANCRRLLNVRNHEDRNCFRYIFVAAYHMYYQISLDRIDRNYQTDKTSTITCNQPGLHQPSADFTMPMGFADILQFETLNNVQVTMFGYDNGQFFPLKNSSYSSDFVMDLLLLYDCDRHHYVPITNLVKVVCYVRELDCRFSYKVCRNCFWICREGLESYNLHLSNCCKNAPAIIHIPSSENNSYKFTNLAATWFVPLVVYLDFELFLRSVSACKGPSDKAFTQVKVIHEPCGFALTVIDHHSSKPIFNHVESSPARMTNFVKTLHKLARDIYQQKRKHPFFKGDRQNLRKSNATHCWICEKSFSEAEDPENTTDSDHCHYSGKFLGWHMRKAIARDAISTSPLFWVKIFKIMTHITYAWH